jgi:hypothetical protein
MPHQRLHSRAELENLQLSTLSPPATGKTFRELHWRRYPVNPTDITTHWPKAARQLAYHNTSNLPTSQQRALGRAHQPSAQPWSCAIPHPRFALQSRSTPVGGPPAPLGSAKGRSVGAGAAAKKTSRCAHGLECSCGGVQHRLK